MNLTIDHKPVQKETPWPSLAAIVVPVIAFFYWVGQYLYVPVLPLYVQSLTEDLKLIGFALSIYGLGHIVIRIPAGLLIGRLGKNKPVIMIGLALLAAGTITMAFSNEILTLILGRGLTGVAAGTWVPLVLLYNKSSSLDNQVRTTATITFISAAARLSASSLSNLLLKLGGFRLPFFIAGCIAITGFALSGFVKEKSLQPKTISIKNYIHLIGRREVLQPSLLSMLAQHINWGLTFGFLPILAKTIGASNSQVAFIATFFFIFFLAGSFLTTSISKSVNLNMLVMSGFFSLIIGLSLAAFSVNVAMIFASQAFVGLAIGVCEPLLMGLSIKSLPVEDQSNAMGFHQTIYAIGMFSGPFISGLLANYFGIKPMIIFNLVFTLVILIIFYGKYFVSHPSKEKEFA